MKTQTTMKKAAALFRKIARPPIFAAAFLLVLMMTGIFGRILSFLVVHVYDFVLGICLVLTGQAV